MYMHRNVTDKFIGTVASCDIISTGSWYGDLPDGVPKEVKLNRKDYIGASKEFEKWCFAGGRKLKGLQRRRLAEKNLFLS